MIDVLNARGGNTIGPFGRQTPTGRSMSSLVMDSSSLRPTNYPGYHFSLYTEENAKIEN